MNKSPTLKYRTNQYLREFKPPATSPEMPVKRQEETGQGEPLENQGKTKRQ